MSRFFLSFSVLLALLALPAQANADSFTDSAAWNDALCGTVIGDELDFGLNDGDFGLPIGLNLTTAWGTISQPIDNNGFDFGPAPNPGEGFIVDETVAWVITPDAGNGFVEGFSVGYVGNELTATVNFADNSTETVIVPAAPNDDLSEVFFGWTNTSGETVSSIHLSATDPDSTTQAAFIYNLNFSFGDPCATDSTAKDALVDLIDGLYDALAAATSTNDQCWIQQAILELEDALDPVLWETEDRLSDQGRQFFRNNFYATYYLEKVSNESLVEASLNGIQDLLGSVVDAEIAFAQDNPGSSSRLLCYAEYFESYADAFADADMYLQAVILHFYAWLFANNA